MPGRILAISDFHFNVFAGLDAAALATLASAPTDGWKSVLAEHAGPMVRAGQSADTNYPLLESALDAAGGAGEVDFVLIPGDFMGHRWQRYYDQLTGGGIAGDPGAYRDFTGKALHFMAAQLGERFGVPILPTLGNDDSFCGDYWLQPDSPFLAAAGAALGPLLRGTVDASRFEQSFGSLGCYTADMPGLPRHRLVSLNTVFWSESYCSAHHDPCALHEDCCGCHDWSRRTAHAVALGQQLGTPTPPAAAPGGPSPCPPATGSPPGDRVVAWLESVLQEADADGKTVWLLMHVPPGVDSYGEAHATTSAKAAAATMWNPHYLAEYLRIVEEHHPVMQVSITGHTHMDDYRVDSVDGTPLLLHKIIPAVSPIFGNNPAFQVLDVDEAGAIRDWQTHYLPGDADTWSHEYDGRAAYGLDQLDAPSVANLFDGIHADPSGDAASHYCRFYRVSAGRPIAADDVHVYACAVLNATYADYCRCARAHGITCPAYVDEPAVLRQMAGLYHSGQA